MVFTGSNNSETEAETDLLNSNDNWPMIHQNAQNTGFLNSSFSYETDSPDKTKILWEYALGQSRGKSPTIADIDGDVFPEIFIASESNLYCFDSIGIVRWIFKANRQIDSSPAVVDIDLDGSKEILFSSLDKKLYCIDSYGKKIWSYDLPEQGTTSSPNISNITDDFGLEIIIGTGTAAGGGAMKFQAYLMCIKNNGTLAWDYKDNSFGSSFDTTSAVGDLTNDGANEIVIGAAWGDFVYIDSNGKVVTKPSRDETHFSSPTIIDIDNDMKLEIIYGADKTLFCNKIEGGKEVPQWNFPTSKPITGTPSVEDINGDGEIEVIFGSDRLYCLNSTGAKLWDFDTKIELSSAAITNIDKNTNNSEIIIGSGNKLYCIDSKGFEKWNITTPDKKDIRSSPAVADIDNDKILEILFVSGKRNEQGTIYALDLPAWDPELDSTEPDLFLDESDITTSKRNIIESDNITINATIHNRGKQDAYSCKVSFYDGEPIEENRIGTIENILVRGMYGSSRVSINWNATLGTKKIYVKISDSNPLENILKNNEAWINIDVSIKPDLYIASTDIVFSKNKPIIGEKIRINATIHNKAGIDLICNVTFYNGNPKDGRQIGNQTIIEVKGYGITNSTVLWTPEIMGDHEVFVVISNSSEEESNLTNNIASNSVTIYKKENDSIFNINVGLLFLIIIIILIVAILIFYLISKKSKIQKCLKCGNKVEKRWKSCPVCGNSLEKEELKCPSCGEKVKKTWKSCPKCSYFLGIKEMKCPNCGDQVEKTWKSCPACGNILEKEKLKCSNCSEIVEKTWKTCPACGNSLEKEKPKCHICGEKIKRTWKSCPACGNTLEKEELKCPNCSEKVEKSWKMCPVCGNTLGVEEMKCLNCGNKMQYSEEHSDYYCWECEKYFSDMDSIDNGSV